MRNKNPIIGINISGDLIKSKNEGAIKFWLIIFSKPLPKLVIIKTPGAIPNKDPKK